MRHLRTTLTAAFVVAALLFVLVEHLGTGTVMSDSMKPTFSKGALLITRQTPPDDLRIGDVVTIQNDAGETIAHRVYLIDRAHNRVALKGDANATPDSQTYALNAAPRVLTYPTWIPFLAGHLMAVPCVGGLLHAVYRTKAGLLVLGLLGLGALGWVLAPLRRRHPEGQEDEVTSSDEEDTEPLAA